MDAVKQLRKLVIGGKKKFRKHGLTCYSLERELNYIERGSLAPYFITAHKLLLEVKKDQTIFLGPGRSWMNTSHVCAALGLTSFKPGHLWLIPDLIWFDESHKPIIEFVVDKESYGSIYLKAIEVFGYNNVARMPAIPENEENKTNHKAIGTLANGDKVDLHINALLICLDGVKSHIEVDDIIDDNGIQILCARDYFDNYDNINVFRFDVLKSAELTRIKKVLNLIAENGKNVPDLYERDIWHMDFDAFNKGDLSDLPFWGDYKQLYNNMPWLMDFIDSSTFDTLQIEEYFNKKEEIKILYDKEELKKYKRRQGVSTWVGKTIYPFGFLFKENAANYLNSWISFTNKQTYRLLQLAASKKEEKEIVYYRCSFMDRGLDNGLKEKELKRIWDRYFGANRENVLLDESEFLGILYLTMMFVRLKNEFPDEFKTASEQKYG